MSNPVLASVLAGLPGPDELIARAASRQGCGPRLKTNSHIHLPPNFSAFDTVGQAVDKAAAEGVAVVGVSNYYDYGVYADFAERTRAAGILPLFGTEIIALVDELVRAGVRINDPGNPGKMYLCGKAATGFEPLSPEAAGLLQVIREKDSTRMAALVERLGAVFAEAGFDGSPDEAGVKAGVVKRHGCALEGVYLQERHVCQAFQEALAYALEPDAHVELLTAAYGVPPKASIAEPVAEQNEIRSQLLKAGKPAYVAETFVDFDHALRLILALGGIPCYPIVADGAKPVCPFEEDPAKLAEAVRGMGVHCTEFIPDRNSPETLAAYAHAMRGAGLVVTAGTEHNTRDLIPIEPACKAGAAIPDDVADLFWEGACVMAAHTYLACHGRPGFVDAAGTPDSAFGTDDERIAWFAAVGAEVIAAYRQVTA